MADVNNVLSAMIDKIFAAGIVVLRENSIMPRLVSNYSDEVAAQKGSTVDIPVQPSIATRDVVPDATSPDPDAMTHGTTPLVLDQWREAPFVLDDKEQGEVMDGVVPRSIRAAVQSLAEYVDGKILESYLGVYNAGLPIDFAQNTVIPAAFVKDATDNPEGLRVPKEARKALNREGAPKQGRVVVLGPNDEGDATTLTSFLAADERGDQGGIIEGEIGRKLGMDWFMDQAVPTHTAGTHADVATKINTQGALAIGVKTATFDSGTAGSTVGKTVKKGDLIKFTGHSQTYVVTADATVAADAITLTWEPGLKVAVALNEDADILKSHTPNLVFHPDAIGFASRPLSALGTGTYRQVIDPVSGLTLRLEVTRQHKRDLFSFDVLFGFKLVEARLIARLISQV